MLDARWLAAVITLSLALVACGSEGSGDPGEDAAVPDGGSDPPDSGPNDAGSGPDAGAVGADAGRARDAGGGSAASVRWITEPEPSTIDGDIGLDYFYQYELAIEGDPFVYGLTLERCTEIAGHAETCTTEPRENLPGTSGFRWGTDPSTYAVGENHYRFRLILDREGTTVDEDEIELVLTVTSCTECVDS